MLFIYVMRKLIGLLTLLFLLSGCFESSLVVGPAIIGGTQGKLAQSSISSALSYGVKYKTGKYPIQHILKQKKEKAVKTTSFNGRKSFNKNK